MKIPVIWLSTLTTDKLKEMLEQCEIAFSNGKEVISFSDVGGSTTFSKQYNCAEMLDAITEQLILRGELTQYTAPVKGLTILED